MRKKRKHLKQKESGINHPKNEPHIRHDRKNQIESDENLQEINPAKLESLEFNSAESETTARKAHQPYEI